MRPAFLWAATAGAATLLFSLAGTIPAFADDDFYRDGRYHRDLHRDIDRDRQDIREDFQQIRRDEFRLIELERDRAEYRRCKNWRAAKDVEREIGYLKRQLDAERRDVRRDIKDVRKDYDRERDFHDRRDRDWDRDRFRGR